MIRLLSSLISINKSNFKNTSLIGSLFIIGLYLMPIDSFPIFPTSNVYRPISFFPIFIYWALTIIQKHKLWRSDVRILILIIIAIIYTFFCGFFWHNSLDGFLKFVLNAFICFVFVSATRNFVKNLKMSVPEILEYFSKVLIIASLIPILLGWLQLFSRFNFIPDNIAYSITSFFSYRVNLSRIQWASGEPSMGFRFIAMSFLFILLFYKENLIVKYFFIINFLILLLLSGSTFGYLFILIVLFFYFLLFPKYSKKFFLRLIILLFLGVVLFVEIFHYLPDYTTSRLIKIVELLKDLNLNNLLALASVDGSTFLRLFNPVIGVIMSIKNYGFGIGGEYYYVQYIEVVKEYFPFAVHFSSVNKVLIGASIITPKSLYRKIIAEFGLIGISIFLSFLYRIYKRIKKMDSAKLAWLFTFMCTMILNTGSYIYIDFIFLAVLLYQISLYKLPRNRAELENFSGKKTIIDD